MNLTAWVIVKKTKKLRILSIQQCTLSEILLEWNPLEEAPKGYVSLVDHALAEGEVSVRQVGKSLQQDL